MSVWLSLIAATAALMLLPAGVSHANWLTDVFKGKDKKSEAHAEASKGDKKDAKKAAKKDTRHDKETKRAASKSHVKLAALGPLNPPVLKLASSPCEPAKFRIAVDVGHTVESEGATSSRNVPEFSFNLRLAQQIAENLKTAGFTATRLLVTEGKAKPSLFRRVAVANDMEANLFLSIHHDSVPNKLLEDWEFEGQKSHFSDRFSGYSVFVSRDNADFKTSFAFAELVGKAMKARGLEYAPQYTMPIMGHYQYPLLDKETGVYAHDELVVLRKTRMPAVLLEAGSIINRDEELKMNSPERRDLISDAVVAAAKEFCSPPPQATATVRR
ncbi:N-acetylmuramoyl-L-alanine amidase family protein [Bradyrhizobium erythrophlei]|jgi:N-acetylmuramoyl-L-alanine amidase|uniref:N-acetylmuramoyl-L-alanine amidase n=1 Tax=Bradyrhizobium erythrophlei TaxID=1437360 RepID=A0A1M7TG94_9BRAD|nr:N-acetylmuramoyl-L-alanine amidase [Bradyrhizobium erythrophlei]SHN69747.1 N-acetylmuramoyl-L-alanine amidase [Bradyrhizobium erythrophlei]